MMQAGPTGIDWPAVSAGISALTLIGTVGIGGVMWGRLSERVGGQTERLDDHKASLATHDKHLGEHDVAIGRLVEWKEGYNAAALIGRHTPEI